MFAPWGITTGAASRRILLVGAALGGAAMAGACRETLDGGASCAAAAALCPGQGIEIRDTIINPTLAYDSTYGGFPGRGAEFLLPLISRGDTVETSVVIRYDTLTTLYLPPADTARAITYVDSARVRLLIELTRAQVPDSVKIDLYDVDAGDVDDTASAPVLARFVPKFRIGGGTFAKAQVIDSLYVPLSDSAVLAHVRDTMPVTRARLRLGIRVSGKGPVAFRIGSVESGAPAYLFYRPASDTSVRAISAAPASAGPTDRADVRRDLMDYMLVSRNTLPEFSGTMALGGVPGHRVYLRFTLPKGITDSTTIIRATLRLTQRPYPFGDATDTLVIHPHIVLASDNVIDNRRAVTLIGLTGLVVTDSLSVVPRDSGQRTLELFELVRQWAAQSVLTNAPPRALVLTAANEGGFPLRAEFYSSTANAALRPTMRITYIPKVRFGVP
jgi:hypothetical protein